MTKNQLNELLKYSNPKELYIVSWNNALRKLFCPFRVVVISEIGNLRKGETLYVDAVRITLNLKTVYEINGQNYFYYHFDILID